MRLTLLFIGLLFTSGLIAQETKSLPDKFWSSTLEAGYSVSFSSDAEDNTLRFNFIQSYHVDQEVGLGLGLGYRDFGFPLFANVRLLGELDKVSLVLEGSGGYTFKKDGLAPLGFIVNPRVGISFPLNGHKNLQLMAGYTFQESITTELPSSSAPVRQRPVYGAAQTVDWESLDLSISINL